ncbi:uncharacterized protein LOC109855538 isoform X2 [Pseudomyrmex gracilis]|uniref:uncharacterized protein LOC109855538 isoform X2 n=1 Tax=Pseudomyrmex gracilis TaxID=219809 RepID=UPI0009959A0E|nr:uncharacterized protein LOC109855538 isoform X2 [Pseudomyrmex gracilis]
METFLKNSMFLIVDDAEPILPIFRSPDYNSPGTIVELTDVGCDTESAFSGHFPRSAFERRRGGAENFRSARRTAKWRNERPTSFTIASNHFKRRNGKYVESAKAQRRDLNYDDVYMADLDYDSYVEDNAYNDLPRNNTGVRYKNDCYAQFGDLRNVIAERSRREYFPRNVKQNYSRDLEFSPNRAYQRENNFPRWFIDNEEIPRENHKSRTKRINEILNRNAEFSTSLKSDDFSDSVSWENDTSGEELISSDSTILKNELREVPVKKKLRNFYMQRNRENEENINSEREEESKEPRLENSQENLSPKPARYRASRSGSVTRKSKILQSNAPIANSPRVQSAQTSIDERSSNVCAAENASTNTRPRSAVERRKFNVNLPTDERTGETANVTSARTSSREDRCQRSIHKDNKFIKKVTNKSPGETSRRPVRTNKRVVNLKINERTYAAKERSNTHRGNCENNKIDRANISAASRSSLEERAATNKRVFSLKRTDTLPLVDIEREKKWKFTSKLPVRTWKRLRTREPATTRTENDITNEDANREQVNIEIPRIRNNLSNKIDDEICKQIAEEHTVRRTADRGNVKRSNNLTSGLFITEHQPASSDAKKMEISNAKRTLQRNKQKYTSTLGKIKVS